MLAPLTSGIYVKAKVEDVDTFIVNIGANVAVNKNVTETKKLVSQQIQEITQVQQQMMADVRDLISQAKKLQKTLQAMIQASE